MSYSILWRNATRYQIALQVLAEEHYGSVPYTDIQVRLKQRLTDCEVAAKVEYDKQLGAIHKLRMWEAHNA